MGQKVVLSEAFTDTSLPILYDDAMQNAGTLAILDFGHSLGGVTGVPVDGTLIPNVAWKSANQLVSGAPGQSALSLVFQTNSTIGSVSTPVKERTSKKGLHVIYSQSADVTNQYNRIALPVAIYNYIMANLSHAFYFELWHRVTRAGIAGAPYGAFSAFALNSGNALWGFQYSANSLGAGIIPAQAASQMLGSAATPGYNTVSNQIIQLGVQGVTGSLSGMDISRALPYFWGNGAGYSNLHVAHSGILYRLVLEDLTVSGRTYAQAKAAGDALWTAAFANGGKFYGDTYTDVTSYP